MSLQRLTLNHPIFHTPVFHKLTFYNLTATTFAARREQVYRRVSNTVDNRFSIQTPEILCSNP